MNFNIIDISKTLDSCISVWPGSTPFSRKILKEFELSDGFVESEIAFNIHTGTHVDAPLHFIEKGNSVDEINLERFFVDVFVLEYSESTSIPKSFFDSFDLENNRNIIIKTKNSLDEHTIFNDKFIALSQDAALFLSQKKINLIGIDGHSIQCFHDPNNLTHEYLLKNDIIILENLNLKNVKPGKYKLIALPLKIKGAEGSPVRAVLLEKFYD